MKQRVPTLIAIQQHTAFIREALPVRLQGLLSAFLEAFVRVMKDHRRLINKAMPAAHLADDLGEEMLEDPLAGFGRHALAKLLRLGIVCHGNDGVGIEPAVPHVQRTHLAVLAQVFPIGTCDLNGDRFTIISSGGSSRHRPAPECRCSGCWTDRQPSRQQNPAER